MEADARAAWAGDTAGGIGGRGGAMCVTPACVAFHLLSPTALAGLPLRHAGANCQVSVPKVHSFVHQADVRQTLTDR